jgi:hypothetical protein
LSTNSQDSATTKNPNCLQILTTFFVVAAVEAFT